MALMAVPCTAAAIVLLAGLLYAAPDLPELTGPVNDFRARHRRARAPPRSIECRVRSSRKPATLSSSPRCQTIEPYGDIQRIRGEALREPRQRHRREGQGQRRPDRARDEGAEGRRSSPATASRSSSPTDSPARLSREVMAPVASARAATAPGLLAGAERIVGRIAQARGVTLDGVRVAGTTSGSRGGSSRSSFGVILAHLLRDPDHQPHRRRTMDGAAVTGAADRGAGGRAASDRSAADGAAAASAAAGPAAVDSGGGFGGFGGGRSGGGGGGASW